MPEPIQITLNSNTYTIPILDGEMDDVLQEILANKEQLRIAKEDTRRAYDKIERNSKNLLRLYIIRTQEFPSE
jgi:hypothetical protein